VVQANCMKIGLVYVMFEAGLKYFSSYHVGQDLNYPYLLGTSAYTYVLRLVYALHRVLNAPFCFIFLFIFLKATSWPTSNTSTRWASPWSSTCPTSSRW